MKLNFEYTVQISFTNSQLADEWLTWMKGKHLQDVVSAGAKKAELIELSTSPNRTFLARYAFPSEADFKIYETKYAPALRAEGLAKFPIEKGVTYQRSAGTIVATI